jgi:hypothetical protein
VLIAGLSLGDVWFHPIALQGIAGADRVRVYGCRLFDAGEQFIKSGPAKPDGSANERGYSGPSGCVVEYCVFEYTDTARSWYTEGVDAHAGHGWVVRHNLFRNIRGPAGAANVGGAVDFWNGSSDNIVECNSIINCAVGIRMGVTDKAGANDNEGGIVRNNFIWRARGACAWADVGIIVNDSPGTKVLHNTVILEDDYANAIEYRFGASHGLSIANNLTNKAIQARDGAQAQLQGNVTNARLEWFADAKMGDLHLGKSAGAVVDRAAAVTDCATDYDGEKRPMGRGVEVGADEVEGGK